MEPPICSYCHADFSPFKTRGKLLRFKITEEEYASNERMKDRRTPHHPKGSHWFCGDHVELAALHTDEFIRDALDAMRAALEGKS